MAPHTIDVTLLDPKIADAPESHNPMGVNRDDTVQWTFTLGGQSQPDLHIRFLGYLPPRDRPHPIPVPGRLPFTSQPPNPTTGLFTVDPDAPDGIYFYGIFRGDEEIKWARHIFEAGGFEAFFGCLVLPHPPN
jgi:hypothetical protein